MLNGDVVIPFTVAWTALDRMESVSNTLSAKRNDQFHRLRQCIEKRSRRVFFAREPHTNDPVTLTEANVREWDNG